MCAPRTVSCQNAFSSDTPITYVFNCAGETKSGQTDPVYKEGIYKLSMNCAQQAAKIGAERYVEISAGNFSSSEKVCMRRIDYWMQIYLKILLYALHL